MSNVNQLVYIKGTGKYLPDKILTNKDLEDMMDTTDKWITSRTGIKQRRIADDSIAASDMGYEAAKNAIVDADLNPEDIDMIIVATITADMFFPSTACIIQHNLGIGPVAAFDISAACSGFTYALSIAQTFVESDRYKNVLVIGAEKLSTIVDWEDRNTCVLFGDGAGACILSKSDDNNRGIVSNYLKADGSLEELLNVPAGGSRMPSTHKSLDERLHYLKMEGTELFKVAVKRMAESVKMALKKEGYTFDDVDVIVPHQANIRILKAVSRAIKVPLDKFFVNIEKYGNMSGASTAVALAEAVEEKFIKKGDLVVLVTFGGGLVWGANVIKW